MMIEKRTPTLQAMRHAGHIDFREQIVRQVGKLVNERRLAHEVPPATAVEQRINRAGGTIIRHGSSKLRGIEFAATALVEGAGRKGRQAACPRIAEKLNEFRQFKPPSTLCGCTQRR